MKGFELTNSTRNLELSDNTGNNQYGDKLGDAVAENFDKILDLASDIVEIRKMKIQSDAVIAHMQETRKQLLTEAEAYCMKKEKDTKYVVEKMSIVRGMMNDFYRQKDAPLTSEDFCKIITEVVNQMCRLENDG